MSSDEAVSQTEEIQPTPNVYTKNEKKLMKEIESMKKQHAKDIKSMQRKYDQDVHTLQKYLAAQTKAAQKFKHLIDTKGLRGHRRPVKTEAIEE